MTISPLKFRELVFQLLFSFDGGNGCDEELIPLLMSQLLVTRKVVKEAYEQAQKVWDMRGLLDQKIGDMSEDYAFDRIGKVERNVLRLGLCELQTSTVSAEIAIAEAIRLARKFSTPEAASFVNAVLDALYKEALSNAPILS